MDQRAMISMEIVKNERTYTFLMPIGSPYGEAYDAAFEFLGSILKQSQDAVSKAEQVKEEDIKETEKSK